MPEHEDRRSLRQRARSVPARLRALAVHPPHELVGYGVLVAILVALVAFHDKSWVGRLVATVVLVVLGFQQWRRRRRVVAAEEGQV